MISTSADLTRKSLLNINDSPNGTLLLEVIEERIISSLGDKPNSSSAKSQKISKSIGQQRRNTCMFSAQKRKSHFDK